LSHNALAKQVTRELHSATEVVLQCFSMRNAEHGIAQSRIQVYFPQRIAATCSTIAQNINPPATFLAIFNPSSLQTYARIYYFALKRSGYEAFSAYLSQKY